MLFCANFFFSRRFRALLCRCMSPPLCPPVCVPRPTTPPIGWNTIETVEIIVENCGPGSGLGDLGSSRGASCRTPPYASRLKSSLLSKGNIVRSGIEASGERNLEELGEERGQRRRRRRRRRRTTTTRRGRGGGRRVVRDDMRHGDSRRVL